MEPILIHRVVATAVLPLTAAGGYGAYSHYQPQYYPQPVPENQCISFSSELYPGSGYRDEVKSLQRFLIKQGYMRGTPTGYFGNATVASLVRFQQDRGLQPTGYVDAQTRAYIANMTCSTYTAQPYPYPTQTYVPQQQDYCNTPYGWYDRTCRSGSYTSGNYDYSRGYDYSRSGQYPSGCTGYYDRSCYVNGQYVGPRNNNEYIYNGPGDSCYYFNGRWQGNCNGSSFNSYEPYNYPNNSYYSDYYTDRSTYRS